MSRGKDQLKLAVLEDIESGAGLVASLGQQSLLSGAVQNASEIAAAIDAITSADVNAVRKHYPTLCAPRTFLILLELFFISGR